MTTKTTATKWIRIYMSGPLAVAEQVCREDCLREGLCVTVEPTRFIYTGGEEAGFVVGLINYPRFPTTHIELLARAERLARLLLTRTCQHSALIMGPKRTTWITQRKT
jgi:hypothetical protein